MAEETDSQLPSLDGWTSAIRDQNGIVLPPFWDEAMARSSEVAGAWWVEWQEWLMRRMMRDVGIQSTDRVFRALLTEGDHQLLTRIQEPPKSGTRAEKNRYKRAQEALAFTQAWIDRMSYPLKALSWQMAEAFAFGSKLAEAEYAPFTVDAPPFRGGAYIAPVDIAPKPRTVYEILVDRSNRVLSVRPRGSASAQNDVPRNNLMILSVGGMDRIPTGEPILASLYRSWYRKQRAYDDESKTAEQSGFVVVNQEYAPVGATQDDGTVLVQNGYEADGVTPKFIRKSKLRVAAESISAARRGMTASMPPGMTAEMMQAGNPDLFKSILDRSDREYATAYLGASRWTQESQHGSRADSSAAADVAESMRDWGRGQIAGCFEEFFGIVLAINFGDKYSDVIPVYDIITEESQDLETIGNFFTGNFDRMTLDQKNWLMAKAGGPAFPEDEESVQPLPTDTQDPAKIDAADQAANAAEVSKFEASFGDESQLTFKTRTEISNGAANRKISGKTGAVRSSDRQFRSLVTRLANGSITEDEFKDRFAYTLQVAHERAYKIGFKHGGGGEELSANGEEYVASTVAAEGDFAANLAAGLEDGSISLAQGLMRARMYANRVRGTANEAFREASVGTGSRIYWDLGGNEAHCVECPIYASLSPWEPDEMPAMPGEGRTPCGSNCLCSARREDGREGFKPVDYSA